MDFYCERTNLNIFDEPINTVSNIFFIISSIIVFKLYNKNKVGLYYFLLPILIFLIGIGSFSFHLLPKNFTLLMDVVPIFLFSFLFIFFFNRDFLNLSLIGNILFIITFVFLLFFLTSILKFKILNGSEFYSANLLTMLLYVILSRKDHEIFLILVKAFFIFFISLSFRTIDEIVCEYFLIGTHFIWHLFNSILLFYLSLIFLKKQ